MSTATSLAAVIDDPEAYRTVMDAFARIDPAIADEIGRRLAWEPNQALAGTFSLIAPGVAAEVERSLESLNAARGVGR